MENVFLKNTSGLVKQAKPIDVLIFNIGLISVGMALGLAYYYIPQNYPGANIPLATLIAVIIVSMIAFNFYCRTIAIPRSGGSYAFVSRAISPIIGFTISLIDSIFRLFYGAVATTFLIYMGISPLFFSLGTSLQSQTLITLASQIQTPIALLIIGVIIIVISGLILIRGMKFFFKVQKRVFAVAMLGTFAALRVIYTTTAAGALSSINAAFAPYISAIQASPIAAVFSRKMTFFACVRPLISLVGGIASINIASEIQSLRKSQFIGMFGSVIVSGFLTWLLAHGFDHVVSTQVQSVINSATTLPIAPYFILLVALMTKSPRMAGIICIGFAARAFLRIPATMAYCSRALLARSFDRIAPYKLADVHPTRFTPVNAIVVVMIANIVLLITIPFFLGLGLALAGAIAWLFIAGSAIIFPYVKKRIYEQTPIAKYRFLGLPLITVSGIVGLFPLVILIFFLVRDQIAGGYTLQSLETLAVLFFLATARYYYIKHKRKKEENIDISKAFSEIPID